MFDRILETEQDSDIILNLIHKETSLSSINVKRSNPRSEKYSMSKMVTPRHQLQRKRFKKIDDYSQKSINDFELVIVIPSPKLTDQENKYVRNSFHPSSKDQCIETNLKRILTHVLRRCDGNKSNAYPSTSALTPAETVALKIYSIELKHSS